LEKHIQRHHISGLGPFIKRTISAQLHLLGALLAVVGAVVLLIKCTARDTGPDFALHLVACSVFSITGFLMFGSSALYHFCSDGFILSPKLEKILNDFDHFSIYLFIAGTYTPFLINAVPPPWSSILLIMIWIIAIVGILYSYFKPRLPRWAQHRIISTSIFLMMGWTLVIRFDAIYSSLSPLTFWLLLGGGLSYSIGALIYAFEWPDFFRGIFGHHELWHLFVMGGFTFHYLLILRFYL
jgi:hemolysin III